MRDGPGGAALPAAVRTFGIALLAFGLAACGDPGTASCPPAPSPTCPATPPSYAGEVKAIVQARCMPCHAPGGESAKNPLTTAAQLKKLDVLAQSQLLACLMPRPDPSALPEAEKATLLAWLACGAPDN